MSTLFRSQALARIANPDQLDKVLQVVRPQHMLGLALVLMLLGAAIVWGVVSTAPVSVQGQGILLSPEGVSDVTAPAAGRVNRILVEVGDTIEAGAPVAELALPDSVDRLTAKRAELAGVRDQLGVLRASGSEYLGLQEGLVAARSRTVSERIATLDAQRRKLHERRRNEAELLTRGFVTASRLTETDTRIAELDDQIASLRNGLVEQNLQRQSDNAQRAQQIRETALRVGALERELDNLEREYERQRVVIAPASGTVVEFSANPGEFVGNGGSLMRVLSAGTVGQGDTAPVVAILYVPNEDGKRVEPGMAAHVMPSTTRPQRDGFIRGTVVKVAKIPSTREGLMRRLRNAALVDHLLRSGAPFEIEVQLERDAATRSGYAWSSGDGPDISIDVGTMARADMVVGRTRIISLALPSFDHVFRWLGLH